MLSWTMLIRLFTGLYLATTYAYAIRFAVGPAARVCLWQWGG